METAKVFNGENGQTVRLPKEFQLEGHEVGVRREGDDIILFPMPAPWRSFLNGTCTFTDDYFDAIAAARAESYPDVPRETL